MLLLVQKKKKLIYGIPEVLESLKEILTDLIYSGACTFKSSKTTSVSFMKESQTCDEC